MKQEANNVPDATGSPRISTDVVQAKMRTQTGNPRRFRRDATPAVRVLTGMGILLMPSSFLFDNLAVTISLFAVGAAALVAGAVVDIAAHRKSDSGRDDAPSAGAER